MNHPDTPRTNLERVTHITESIERDGNNYIGKARILETPLGCTVKALLEGGVQLGVSSRGMGSVKKNGKGINEVQEDFNMSAIDIVYQPSAPDAFVEGLMEGADFVWDSINEDVEFVEQLKEDMKRTKSRDIEMKKLQVFESFLDKIRQG